MPRRLFLTLLFLLVTLSASAANLRVSAASSLTDALHDIARIYEHDGHDTLLFDFGASSLLARQITEGAPSDVFISADELKMDQLQQRGFIIKSSRRSILSNTLVIIVPSDSNLKISGPTDLTDNAISNIAVAEPQSVPAGIYAKEYLRAHRVWDRIKDKIVDLHARDINARVRGYGFAEPDTPQALTDREREVLQWAAMGKTSDETAAILAVSHKTVEAHIKSAMIKLGASNKTQATVQAVYRRLIDI